MVMNLSRTILIIPYFADEPLADIDGKTDGPKRHQHTQRQQTIHHSATFIVIVFKYKKNEVEIIPVA